MSELRTLRWGGTETIQLKVGETVGIRPAKSQVVQLAWDTPVSWNVLLAMNPAFDATEAHTFTLQWTFNVGVGQASTGAVFNFTFAPSGGVYAPQTQQILVPGEQVQIQATLLGTIGATNNESFNVGAWGAPNNADILGELRRWQEQMQQGQGDPSYRDMGMGGPHEMPLHYRPR